MLSECLCTDTQEQQQQQQQLQPLQRWKTAGVQIVVQFIAAHFSAKAQYSESHLRTYLVALAALLPSASSNADSDDAAVQQLRAMFDLAILILGSTSAPQRQALLSLLTTPPSPSPSSSPPAATQFRLLPFALLSWLANLQQVFMLPSVACDRASSLFVFCAFN